jgi:ribosomal protein S11
MVTITVLQPTVDISASLTRVSSGGTSMITWSANNVTSCTVTDSSGNDLAHGNANSSNAFSKNSPYSATIISQTVFTITCHTGGGPDVSKSVTVNILPLFQEF